MPELEPREATASAILLEACAKRLHEYAQGLVRKDLAGEVPRLRSAAIHATQVARESLTQLETRLQQ